VENCLAVLFIIKLGDLDPSDYKSTEQMMIIVKYRFYLDDAISKEVAEEDEVDMQLSEPRLRDETKILNLKEVECVKENPEKCRSLFEFKSKTSTGVENEKTTGVQLWREMLSDAELTILDRESATDTMRDFS